MSVISNAPAAGFMPDRLKEAREARGINTMVQLAGLLGRSASTVSRWEDGKTVPTVENVAELARALNVRAEHFYRPKIDHGPAPSFFRSLASAKVRDRDRQRARMSWLQDISHVVQHYVEFPTVDIPDVLAGESYLTLREEDLERIAIELRKYWTLGLGPLGDAVALMERVGFVVAVDEVGTTKLDGLCRWSSVDDRPYVLLAADKMNFVRRQMDAIHEMAHAVLHRHVDMAGLRENFELIEAQAFRLASAFLLPSTTYPLDIRRPSLNTLLMLKRKWRVSIKAQIKRCADLSLIDDDAVTQLYKYHSAKGWNKEEPLDREFPLQTPRLLAQALGVIVEQSGRQKRELLEFEFTIPAPDIEQLAGLSEGWFGQETGSVVKWRGNAVGDGVLKTDGGTVIGFAAALARRQQEQK